MYYKFSVDIVFGTCSSELAELFLLLICVGDPFVILIGCIILLSQGESSNIMISMHCYYQSLFESFDSSDERNKQHVLIV